MGDPGDARVVEARRDAPPLLLAEARHLRLGAADVAFVTRLHLGLEDDVLRERRDFPVHSHDTEGQLSILVVEGEGEFLAEGDAAIPAAVGDLLVSEIAEPHGVRARTDMRILVTIAPPF
jgi:hypothetical protein